ncbi:reverse transcriptase domain-containing protein [Tanacetum coccineum]|uniref:Reverse transcriptase domain-containing protein n=1 Tax=Tanacetum coccineum TaxID=301880 RepID=A0ABQ4WZU0_9ASTR
MAPVTLEAGARIDTLEDTWIEKLAPKRTQGHTSHTNPNTHHHSCYEHTSGLIDQECCLQWLKQKQQGRLVKVSLRHALLQDDALTWWNAHVKTTTPEAAHAMPWATLKKMMTDKYCPRGEIKKIETEMWNLKVKGTDVVAYSR